MKVKGYSYLFIISQSLCHSGAHSSLKRTMAKSLKYFSHYFKEIQTTKDKFKEYIIRDDSEAVKLIEMNDFTSSITEENDAHEEEESIDERSEILEKILDLGKTLDDINRKLVDVKRDAARLEAENKVIEDYVENLMNQSKTFGPANL